MATPARTFIGGADYPDIHTWPQVMWDYFASDTVSENVQPNTPYYRVLFAPAFHPEYCVTVVDFGRSAHVSLLTYRTNLWYWNCYELQRANGRWRQSPRDAPKRWEEATVRGGGRLRRFRERVPATIPLFPDRMKLVGCDGMHVYCRLRKPGGEPQESETWQASEPATHELAVAAHRLAVSVLKQPESKKALAVVKNYRH
jgi:hypothetical protein